MELEIKITKPIHIHVDDTVRAEVYIGGCLHTIVEGGRYNVEDMIRCQYDVDVSSLIDDAVFN